jgi:predicted nucleic-acid-binding Zn-ribbon protein
MKTTGKCPKCGGTELIADAKALDGYYEAPISVAKLWKPDAMMFKGKQSTTMSAWVCSTCGYVELCADDPGKLKLPKA